MVVVVVVLDLDMWPRDAVAFGSISNIVCGFAVEQQQHPQPAAVRRLKSSLCRLLAHWHKDDTLSIHTRTHTHVSGWKILRYTHHVRRPRRRFCARLRMHAPTPTPQSGAPDLAIICHVCLCISRVAAYISCPMEGYWHFVCACDIHTHTHACMSPHARADAREHARSHAETAV